MLKDCLDMEAVKEDVLRLVEAQIAGCIDLSPEEMVDAAFIMVKKINQKLDESPAIIKAYSDDIVQEAKEVQLR